MEHQQGRRFIDPDGMGPTDVILTGPEKQKAFAELQKSVGNQLSLTMDNKGKVSYSQTITGPLTGGTQTLVNAIDDKSVTVNLDASNKNYTSKNEPLLGGSFMGNKVNRTNGKKTVEAFQEVNATALETASDNYNKPGADMLHELTEAYIGAKISQRNGVSSPRSGKQGSVWPSAHSMASEESGDKYIESKNANGVYIGDRIVDGGHVKYFVLDAKGNDVILQSFYTATKKL